MSKQQTANGRQPNVQVFALNDYDWWAGSDLESVKLAYARELGYSDDPDPVAAAEAAGMFDEPRMLNDEEMRAQRFCRDLESWPESEEISFQERLVELVAEGATFPCLFATAEF